MLTTRPRRVLALLALASTALVPLAVHAQTSGVGTISGTVLDATGAAVQKAASSTSRKSFMTIRG